MLEILSYDFMQNALTAAILVSIITAIIGSLIVVNKMVFLSGGIAHSAYGVIGIAIFYSLPVLLCASIFSIIVTIIIAFLSYKKRENLDIIIGLMWAIGMSFGILLVDLTPGYNSDLMSYLFGSLMAVSSDDITFMVILLITILAILVLFFRDILAVSYDSEYAKLRGVKTRFFYTLILILASLSIVISIKVVGLILIIALLTIPIYIAQRYSSGLFSMMVLSAVLSTIFSLLGLYISYEYDLTSGPSIILISSIVLFLIFIYEFVYKLLFK